MKKINVNKQAPESLFPTFVMAELIRRISFDNDKDNKKKKEKKPPKANIIN